MIYVVYREVSFYCVFAFVLVGLALSADEDISKQNLKINNATTKAVESSKEGNPNKSETIDKKSTLNTTHEENPTTSNSTLVDNPTTNAPVNDEKRCSEMIGQFMDGVFQGLVVEYDVQKLLNKYGGAPGKVNATWTEKEDAPVKEEDLEKKPLPDADEKYWLYKYGDTDSSTYIRIEHAVRRFSGTPKAFLEIRGQLYFTPDDFCGKSRRAYYTVDDRGFTFQVSHEYCWIGGNTVSCASPATCTKHNEGYITCVAAPSTALLSSLIGG